MNCTHQNQIDCTVYDTGALFGSCLDCLKESDLDDIMVSSKEILTIIKNLEDEIKKIISRNSNNH